MSTLREHIAAIRIHRGDVSGDDGLKNPQLHALYVSQCFLFVHVHFDELAALIEKESKPSAGALTLTRQKFFRGQRVNVNEDCNGQALSFEAIVIASFSDVNGGKDFRKFQLLQLQDGVPVMTAAWFHEDSLTLLDNDRDAGELLIQEHKYGV